jgi:hypothetical protein
MKRRDSIQAPSRTYRDVLKVGTQPSSLPTSPTCNDELDSGDHHTLQSTREAYIVDATEHEFPSSDPPEPQTTAEGADVIAYGIEPVPQPNREQAVRWASSSTRWNQYDPENRRRAQNISPQVWESFRGTISRLHHTGQTKQQILDSLLSNDRVRQLHLKPR